MNKRLIGVLASAALLAACGSDNAPTASSVCSKLPGVWQGLNTKVAQCPDIQTQLAGFSNVPVQEQACMTAVAQCNADDVGKLNTFLDCMGALPTCTTDTMVTWGASLTACYNNDIVSANISAQCKSAVGLP